MEIVLSFSFSLSFYLSFSIFLSFFLPSPPATIPTHTLPSHQVRGILEKIDDTTLHVSELPIGTWTQAYKEMLEGMLQPSEKAEPSIKEYAEHHTDTTVSFTITLTEQQMAEAEKVGLDKKFKIETSVSTSNMVGRLISFFSLSLIISLFHTFYFHLIFLFVLFFPPNHHTLGAVRFGGSHQEVRDARRDSRRLLHAASVLLPEAQGCPR